MNNSEISLRPATFEDLEMVLRWRNDPFILSRGTTQRTVGRAEHEKWFAETISGTARKMFIILHRENPVGQVRFERASQDDCVISVYLVQEFTGRGLGVVAIKKGCASIFRLWDVRRVIACVRVDNAAGRSAFLKARFAEIEASDLCPERHFSLMLSRRDAEQ